jgi:hypothetical protein
VDKGDRGADAAPALLHREVFLIDRRYAARWNLSTTPGTLMSIETERG